VLWGARPAIAAVEHVLAGFERRSVDQPPVPPFVDLPIPVQFADVEPVAQDV
jgi:hypothetical protein